MKKKKEISQDGGGLKKPSKTGVRFSMRKKVREE